MKGIKINCLNAFSRKPDAVLFDLDHTLYNYNDAHNYALKKVINFAQSELNIKPDRFLSLYDDAKKIVKKRLGNTASSHSRLLYFQTLTELFGMHTQPLLVLQLEQTYWQYFFYKSALFEGVVALFSELKMLHVPIALVTDLTTQVQFRKVIHLKIDSYIDFIVSSEEAGVEKPHAKPFELALEKLKLTAEHNIWMVGEHVQKDLLGAKHAVNAITIQKIHDGLTEGSSEFSPDMVVKSFDGLMRFIEQQKKEAWC